jgi:hypothetical protein
MSEKDDLIIYALRFLSTNMDGGVESDLEMSKDDISDTIKDVIRGIELPYVDQHFFEEGNDG